jgi:hypothetical protein
VASKHQKEGRKGEKREVVDWWWWWPGGVGEDGWVEVVEKEGKCELLMRRSQVAMTSRYHSAACTRNGEEIFWQPKWVKKQQRLLFPEI